jgi:predicted transcriptional regulator
MKAISLKLDDSVFAETEIILDTINIPRNRYINEALAHYNTMQRNKILEEKLRKESALVQKDSLTVLEEFENLDCAD